MMVQLKEQNDAKCTVHIVQGENALHMVIDHITFIFGYIFHVPSKVQFSGSYMDLAQKSQHTANKSQMTTSNVHVVTEIEGIINPRITN